MQKHEHPMEVKKIWTRRRLIKWVIANLTALFYEYAKKHMSSTAECTVRISWTLEQELSSEFP